MGHSLRPEQEKLVKGMLMLEQPSLAIAAVAKCSTRQVRRIKLNLLKYNSVRAPKVVHQGRPLKVTRQMEEV
jgi:hypothetical protein